MDNKLIKGGIFVLVLLITIMSSYAAFYFPMPINGKVEGINVGNLPIKVTNLRTGKTQEVKTSTAGEFLVDAANFDDNGGTLVRYQSGDNFKIEVLSCISDSPECTQTVVYSGQANIFTTFDLTSVILPCTDCGVDNTPYPSCSSCCPADTTPFASCESCCTPDNTQCDSCCPQVEKCPEADNTLKYWIGALGGLLVLVMGFMGGGLKSYKNRAGNVVMQHRHKGILAYHDVNTKHVNKEYQHRLYKDNPIGFAYDINTIETKGGLI